MLRQHALLRGCAGSVLGWAILLAAPAAALATADTWKTATDGFFSDGSKWTDGTAPDTPDSATFNLAGTYTVSFNSDPSNQDLFVQQGNVTFAPSGGWYSYNVDSGGGQSVNVTGGSLTLGGTGGTLSLSVGNALNVQTGGAFNVTHGSQATAYGMAIGTLASASATRVSVDGAGSKIYQYTGSNLTVGAAANGGATLSITNGGVFQGESDYGPWQWYPVPDTVTVNKTGLIDIGGGGTFQSIANIVIDGGMIRRSAGGTFLCTAPSWGNTPPLSLNIVNGGALSVTGSYTHDYSYSPPATININGAGSRIETLSGGNFTSTNPSCSLNITAGGRLTSDDYVVLAGSVTINGAASRVSSGTAYASSWSRDGSSTSTPAGAIKLGGWTQVTSGGLLSAASALDVNRSLTVDGMGSHAAAGPMESRWGKDAGGVSVTFSNQATGSFPGGVRMYTTGTSLTIQSGASVSMGYLFVSSTDATSTGPARIDVKGTGSTLTTTGPIGLVLGDGSGVVSGEVITMNVTNGGTYIGNTTGTTILEKGSLITIDGGTVILGMLEGYGGRINLLTGSLSLVGDVAVQPDGPLGEGLSLNPGANLSLTGTFGVDPYCTAILNGGSLTAARLMVNGTFQFRSGTLAFTGPPRIFVGTAGSFETTDLYTNTGQIELMGGAARVAGPGALINNGLILGDGEITKPTTNAAGGEIRVGTGQRLLFSGTSGPNAGQITLQDGTAEFTQSLTNAAGGLITGRGTLMVGGTGLLNQGSLVSSGGTTDIFGKVNNVSGGRIITTGGATTSFWDDVVHNGVEFRTSTGCATVFLGSVSGSGSFTGPGTVYFEGDLSPGNSPAAVSFGGDVVFAPCSGLNIDLGGAAPGAQYDTVSMAGQATLGGTLNVLKSDFRPAHNETFQVLSYASRSGTFDAFTGLDLGNRLRLVPTYTATSLVLTAAQGGSGAWRADQGGSLGATTNWADAAPGAAGDVATFGPVITAPRQVTVDEPTTLGAMVFDSARAYTVTGPGTVTLQATSSGHARIDVTAASGGANHAILAPLALLSALDIGNLAAGDLTFQGGLSDLAGLGITKTGPGSVTFDGPLNFGPSSLLMVEEGTFNLASDAGSDPVADLSIDVMNATLNFDANQHLDVLTIGDGGKVVLRGARVVVVNDLQIGGLDLGSVVLTPEPATLALVILGLAPMLRRRQRRRG